MGVAGLRQPGQFIPELESLRGWAILLVVAFHYFGIMTGGTEPLASDSPAWLRVVASGNTGVTLFFVLSGFLLSQPFIASLRGGRSVDIKRFYIARVLRIVPLYYLFVVLAWWSTGNTMGALQAFAFIHVGFSLFPFSVSWWSLCTEMQFYLLLPWLMLLLHFRYGRWLLGLGLLTWGVAHIYYFQQPRWLANPQNWVLQASVFGRGLAFLVGAACASLYASSYFHHLVRRQWLVWGILLVLLWALYQLLSLHAQLGIMVAPKSLPMYHNIEALLWGGLLLCCVAWRSSLRVVLVNRLLNHFGMLSYSIYLLHVPIQFYAVTWFKAQSNSPLPLDGQLGNVLLVGFSFALIWGLSFVLYHWFERPMLQLKSRLSTYTERRDGQRENLPV
ncbi:acyltransferase [Aquipseudomonas campi]|uniref:Acyltransferase n=1 Tax=Aquipseudomonas campi TaxID=2731681 RepID=A0A6M8FPJ9_9GAMM|nr:acyltransferase [Pseudomonas campi]